LSKYVLKCDTFHTLEIGDLEIGEEKFYSTATLETLSTTLLATGKTNTYMCVIKITYKLTDFSLSFLVITDVSTSADSPVVQTEGNIDATTNLIAVVMTTIVSLCVLTSLILYVILYFRKQRRNINSQSKSTTGVLKSFTLLNCSLTACHTSLLERRNPKNTVGYCGPIQSET